MSMPRLTSALESVFSVAGGAQIVGGMMVGDVGLAQASTSPGGNVTIPVWAISLLVGGSLSALGYLLKRALDQLDTKLNRLDLKLEDAAAHRESVERRIAVVETKVDTLAHHR